MTQEKLTELLLNHEKITVEYKEAKNAIPDNVYESVSAFSNRYGGYIILGVADDGGVLGVNEKSLVQMKKNFVNQLNNSNKMSPTLYLTLEDYEIDEKKILVCYVPASSTVVKCCNRIYDRNEDGDFDITDSPIQVENMYARKIGTFNEHKIFPYVEKSDLKMELFSDVRRLVQNRNAEHSWLKMSDDDFFVSAGLYEKDFLTGQRGFNLAAVMLFGKDSTILSCCPGYVTDAIYREENQTRYDDRIRLQSNLIEAYDALMKFIQIHTSDKFYLENTINTSIRDIIAREVVANILVHRDFSNAFPAKLVITKDWLKTENWCRPRRHGNLLEDDFSPYPKNPVIANFFTAIGRTEEIGSGVKNLYKYTPIYSGGGLPLLFEDDIFRIEIPLSLAATNEQSSKNNLTEREEKIKSLIVQDKSISIDKIAEILQINRRTALRDIQQIKSKINLAYDKKTASWVIEKER